MAASFVLIAFTCILSLSVSGNATTSNEFESSSYSDFSWSNCNKIPVPIKVKELSIIPSKLTLGKGFQLNTTVVLDEGIGKSGTAIEVELSLKMKIDGEYSELCDLAPAAFCYFPNFCNILDTMGNRCPPKLKERLHNCTCPFLEEHYKITNFTAFIPEQPFRISGEFQATIVIREKGRDIGCILVYFQIEN